MMLLDVLIGFGRAVAPGRDDRPGTSRLALRDGARGGAWGVVHLEKSGKLSDHQLFRRMSKVTCKEQKRGTYCFIAC